MVVSIAREVKLFVDEDKTDVQKVVVDNTDKKEPWIVVSHCGEEISMSVKNWESLIAISRRAKKKANIANDE